MKDYKDLKKKLETRRLDFDARVSKQAKSKKESDEEFRISQMRYEDSVSDLTNKMISLSMAEETQLGDLLGFIDSQHDYFMKCLAITSELSEKLKEFPRDVSSPEKYQFQKKSPVITSKAIEKVFEKSYSIPSIPQEPPRSISKSIPKGSKRVLVIYDFIAENANELTIRKGDILLVTSEVDPGWWLGDDCNGNNGLFPSNYTQPYDGDREKSEHKVEQKRVASTAVGACNTCGCNDFTVNAFKPATCNNCFHKH